MAKIGEIFPCAVCSRKIKRTNPRHLYCEKCRKKAYAKNVSDWGKKNREYRNMRKREWYETNREYVRTYNRRYKRAQRARQSEES